MNPGPGRASTLERLDGSEGTIADWVALQLAVRAVDAPDSALPAAARVRGDLEHPWPGTHIDQWLARVDGQLAGILTLGMRLTDNTDITVIRGLAQMSARMTIGVPTDDLDWQPEVWDADRVRSRDAIAAIRQTRSYTTAARHDPTGELAGYTALDLPAGNDAFRWQEATLIVPGHRGHRLGLRLKIENLYHVLRHEPALAIVDSANADVNDHMIAINEALGFQPISRQSECELKLAGER